MHSISTTLIQLFTGTALLLIFSSCGTTSHSWEADPEVVDRWQEQRPQYRWDESEVTRFELPELMVTDDGDRVVSRSDWEKRRGEILDTFRDQMYGRRPDAPQHLRFRVVNEDSQAMGGAATLRQVTIESRHNGRSHQFDLTIFLPNDSDGEVPLFLLMNNRDADNTDPERNVKSGFWPAEEVIGRGYGIAAIQNGQLAPDDTETWRQGVVRMFEGDLAEDERPGDAWGALAAWGWGASRAMDYFEMDERIDDARVAVLGHSRGGKASLWAGAEDERFALVISNDSGSGGAALSKREYGETVKAVTRFTHWFADNFHHYIDREQALPFDQHMLISMMAPRAVYVASADEDLWADPRGEFLSVSYASPAWALWGEPEIAESDLPPLDQPLFTGSRGYHVRSGGHNLTPQDWGYFMDFADRLWER